MPRRTVITGAGSGIGAALARELAARGDRLVLADLNPASVTAVAEELGALAVPGDVATTDGARALVAAATGQLGGIDLFVANAGIGVGGGPETGDDDWDLAWDVNVMSHVRAAREVVPAWLASGRGHWVSTVSAAGLLTMPGSAPYSVTKHAAQAFAEWMGYTYAHRGIKVQAICPQGVKTPLLDATGTLGQIVLAPSAIDASDAAVTIADGLDADAFLILPHPEVAQYYAQKAAEPDRWLTTMSRAQARIDEALGVDQGVPPADG